MAALRAFPIVYARDLERCVAFYERLGFEKRYQFPTEGEPGYVTLRRGDDDLGITYPDEQTGGRAPSAPRFELFVYVHDVDSVVEQLRRHDVPVIREPADMPWGERIAYVADPEGNPVVLAHVSA